MYYFCLIYVPAKYKIVGTLKDGAQWDPRIVKEYEEEMTNQADDKPPPEFGFKDAANARKSTDVTSSSNQSAAQVSRDPGQKVGAENDGQNCGQSKIKDAPSNGESDTKASSPDTKAKDLESETVALKKRKTSSLCIIL
jgi:hypothetical protein